MLPAFSWRDLESKKQLERAEENRRDDPGSEKRDSRNELPGECRPQKGGGVEAFADNCGCGFHGDRRLRAQGFCHPGASGIPIHNLLKRRDLVRKISEWT